jgi:hypothetical protein
MLFATVDSLFIPRRPGTSHGTAPASRLRVPKQRCELKSKKRSDRAPLAVQAQNAGQAMGVREMTSSNQFNAFAAARGEGLHPKLRELFERTAASPSSAVVTRHDGMLQAGPSPRSGMVASQGSVTSFRDENHPAAPAHKQETQTPRRRTF